MSNRILIHLGAGDTRRTYDFDPGRLLNVEAIAVQKQTGLTVLQLLAGLTTMDAQAITAAVWILRKRQEPRLRFDEVVFAMDEVRFEDPDTDEPDDESEEISDNLAAHLEDKPEAPKAPVKRAARKRT